MSLILDTNILLLYLVGCYDVKFIRFFKKTAEFTEDDFIKLKRIVKKYNREILITPQILAELSNHSEKIKEPRFSLYMDCLINKLKNFNEKYIEMSNLLEMSNDLIKLGFTDLSIVEAGLKFKCLILTKDFKLSQYAIQKGCMAYNLTQVFYE